MDGLPSTSPQRMGELLSSVLHIQYHQYIDKDFLCFFVTIVKHDLVADGDLLQLGANSGEARQARH